MVILVNALELVTILKTFENAGKPTSIDYETYVKKQNSFARLASWVRCFGNSDHEYNFFFSNRYSLYESHN